MSSSFDWGQFEEVPEDAPQEGAAPFDWSQFREVDPATGMVVPTAAEVGRNIAKTAATVGTSIAGIPGDIASLLGRGVNLLEGALGEKGPKQGKLLIENPFTSHNLSQMIEKAIPSLAPKNEQEKEWDDALSLLSSLFIPGPKGAKFVDPRKSSEMYKAARLLGFTEKEITPLIQGERKVSLLGKLAAKTEGMKKTVNAIQDKLGSAYDNLTFQASRLPEISKEGVNSLVKDYRNIIEGWKRTLAVDSETQKAISFAEQALDTLISRGATPEMLLNFNKNVNRAVKWNSIDGGKKMLAALKEPARKILRKEQPYIGKQADNIDKMWGKMERFTDSVGLKRINDFYNYDEDTKKLVKLAFKMGPYMIAGLSAISPKAALGLGSAIAGRHLATALLTNPKLQALHRKMLSAIKNGSYKSSPKLLLAWERLTGQKVDDALSKQQEFSVGNVD